jgi:hypothetical protein
MKPLLLFCVAWLCQPAPAQSLDYISVRKKNGAVVKNFYSGSDILLQTTEGTYLKGPIQAIRNDSVFVILYDIRYVPTIWGSFVRDTVLTTIAGIRQVEISRVYLNKRRSFWQRTAPPLLMIGGAGYLTLNVLNGGLYGQSIAGNGNLQRIGTAAGVFGLGFLLRKLFSSDGFSKRSHRIVYVDLKPAKPL